MTTYVSHSLFVSQEEHELPEVTGWSVLFVATFSLPKRMAWQVIGAE